MLLLRKTTTTNHAICLWLHVILVVASFNPFMACCDLLLAMAGSFMASPELVVTAAHLVVASRTSRLASHVAAQAAGDLGHGFL